MPLSEEELRLLEQMERALVEEDPKLASTMRGTRLRRSARRRSYVAIGAFVVGVVVLMTGAITRNTVVGIIGFVVMLGSAYVALTSWQGQEAPSEEAGKATSDHPAAGGGFSLIEGGKARKRQGRPKQKRSGSFMDRMEERWRRRRDQGGF